MKDQCYKTCEDVKNMSASERLEDYEESLEGRMACLEKDVSCLNLTRDLLIDWTYHNTVINKDDEPKYPPEIEVAIKLINLVVSDLELTHDIIVDDRKELNWIVKMIQDKQ